MSRIFAYQSDSEFPGQLDEGDRSILEHTNSFASGRPDEVTSTYGMDDFSPALNYASAESGDYDEEEETDPAPYYHPAMPTPAENPAPPPPPMKMDDPSPLQTFLASPVDFIFGGNGDDDDDVSTLDGGFLADAVRWGDEATTMATDRTSKSTFKLTEQVIYEDDEAEAGSLGTVSKEIRSNDEGPPQEDNEQYYDQETQDEYEDDYEDDYEEAEEDMYTTSEYLQAQNSKSQRDEESSLFCPKDSYSGSYQDVERSTYSASGSARFSVSDEDAARSRAMDEEASLSLSLALGTRQSEPRNSTDSASMQASRSPAVHGDLSWGANAASAHSSRSEALRRSIILNKSWRSAKSVRSVHGDRDSRSISSAAMTYRSARSVMPETPEIIPRRDPNAPMMTRGMSGRAVVHVSMDCSVDGSIKCLDYSMPVVDVPVENDPEYFDDEDTVVTTNKALLPWFDYYFSHFKIVRTCHSRKCYRINAVLLLFVAFCVTVSLSVRAVVSPDSGEAPSSSASRGTSSQYVPPPNEIPGVKLPSEIDTHLKDWFNAEGMKAAGKDDVPFYFHIPLSGALIASECWTHCLGFVVASDGGKAEVSDSSLKAVQVVGSSFVNVDLSNLQGIEHAAKMNLVPSSLPDVAISPLFSEAIETLFSQSHPTTLIITLRQPISRAVAMFDYIKRVNPDPELADMTLDQYALSGRIENNYVVRLLTGKSSGKLSVDDVNFCKELLRRKAILGLYEDMEGSVNHIQRYFGWTPVAEGAINCEKEAIQEGLTRESAIAIDSGSSAYSLIQHQNLHDIALYNYVKNFLVPYQMEVMARQSQDSSASGR